METLMVNKIGSKETIKEFRYKMFFMYLVTRY
jgi:hypothetical protein